MKKVYRNSLFFKLAVSVLAGMSILAVCLSYLNIYSSEHIFSDMFSESQEKIFEQMEKHFYDFYIDLTEIAKEVADNRVVQEYLEGSLQDPVMQQRITYDMQRQVEQTKISRYDNVTLLLTGSGGRSYMYSHADVLSVSLSDISNFAVTRQARENPESLVCKYMESGFTNTMKKEPVIVVCRAIPGTDGGVSGYVYLMIKEQEVRDLYDYFLTGTSDIIVLNQDQEVISTNNRIYFLNQDEALSHLLDIVWEAKESRIYHTQRVENGERICYLVQQFTNTDFVIVGTVNARRTFYEKYNLVKNIALAVFMASVIIFLIFIFVRRQTRPIYRLVNSMREQKQRDFSENVPVEGTEEVQELSRTYNEMITDLRGYIDQIVQTEQARRTAELHALQMQINPHYIYNTLAGIKWLIMQGDSHQSIAAMDAFIELLRNTISNADELVTIRQEERNLRNYVKINQMRYGDKIHVGFYIQEECMEAKIPKLALQPFIENAFFHAFPKERHGNINVFVYRAGELLYVEIADDGVGMVLDCTQKEHFTGIGIQNIDERLKLVYGSEYGVRIDSEVDCGTTVHVEIPYETG